MITSFTYTNKGKNKVAKRYVFITELDQKYVKGVDLTEYAKDIETLIEYDGELSEIEEEAKGVDEETLSNIRVSAWDALGLKYNYRCFLRENMTDVVSA